MYTYYFSGSLTTQMHDLLLESPNFEPLDILISQLDRPSILRTIEWKKEGFCKTLFIDSGAYSVHTGQATVTADEYIDFLNSIDEDYDVCAQLDIIPGEFGQPKSKEDYEESARASWENFLYMRRKLKSPEKLMPVFHYGESWDALRHMLAWEDDGTYGMPKGTKLGWVGASPANDSFQATKDIYLQNFADAVATSPNPDVKVHVYGMTSLNSLATYPCYSADSISHRLWSAYNKVLSEHFGIVSITKRPRTIKAKSNMSFVELADEHNLKLMNDEFAEFGFNLEELQESSAHRVAYNIRKVQKLIKTKYKYDPKNWKRAKKLF